MKTLWDLFFTFFRFGLFTVGGGLAMIPLVYDEAINKRHWMTEEEMIDCVAVTQSLPGAFIINMATYIGKKQKGILGSIAATVGVMLPSLILMSLIMVLLKGISNNPYIAGAFEGAKAGAVGLVLIACYRLGKPVVKRPVDFAIALISFSLVIFFDLSPIWAILFGIACGLLLYFYKKVRKKGGL